MTTKPSKQQAARKCIPNLLSELLWGPMTIQEMRSMDNMLAESTLHRWVREMAKPVNGVPQVLRICRWVNAKQPVYELNVNHLKHVKRPPKQTSAQRQARCRANKLSRQLKILNNAITKKVEHETVE